MPSERHSLNKVARIRRPLNVTTRSPPDNTGQRRRASGSTPGADSLKLLKPIT